MAPKLLKLAAGLLLLAVKASAQAASTAGDEAAAYSYLIPQTKKPDYASAAEVWERHRKQPRIAKWESLKIATSDTWDYIPEALNSTYKNPCFFETGPPKIQYSTLPPAQAKDFPFRCMPYFQILGVSKCGTTDLYHRLSFHPELDDVPWKGPHFWDESAWPGRRTNPDPTKYDGSFPAYVRIFDKPAAEILANPSHITGEASSNTFTGVLRYCRGVGNPNKYNLTLAEYLWEANPWSRFIVMFRDPVKRYYSAYYYYRPRSAGPGTPQDFHARAVQEVGAWNKQLLERGEFGAARNYEPQQLVKGLYALFLPYWFEVWPRDRFMFIRNEDYKVAPKHHVAAVADFLGMKSMHDGDIKEALKMEAKNVKEYPDMLPETKELLQGFYRPYNQRLKEAMGGDDRWLWGY